MSKFSQLMLKLHSPKTLVQRDDWELNTSLASSKEHVTSVENLHIYIARSERSGHDHVLIKLFSSILKFPEDERWRLLNNLTSQLHRIAAQISGCFPVLITSG